MCIFVSLSCAVGANTLRRPGNKYCKYMGHRFEICNLCNLAILSLQLDEATPCPQAPRKSPRHARGCHWRGSRIVEHANAAQTDSHLRSSETMGRRSTQAQHSHHPHDPKIKYIPSPSLGFHPAEKGDFNHVFPSQDMFDHPHWDSNCLSYLAGASTTSQFFVNMKQRMGPNGPCKLT